MRVMIVSVNSNVYHEKLDLYKFSLIRRVILAKGNTLWRLADLRTILLSAWDVVNWLVVDISGTGF